MMELFQTAVIGLFAVAIAPVAGLCGVTSAVLQLAARQLFYCNLGCAANFLGGTVKMVRMLYGVFRRVFTSFSVCILSLAGSEVQVRDSATLPV